MTVTLYYNPNCSNARAALQTLRACGIEPKIVDYLKTPPGRNELARLAQGLQQTAGASWPGLVAGMLRAKEPLFAELGLAGASDDALLDAVAAHPLLLNRPIVETPKGTKLCRPGKTVREIL